MSKIKCTKCKEEKDRYEFSNCARKINGKNSSCKRCMSDYKKLYRQSDKGKAVQKLYDKSDKGKASTEKYLANRGYGISKNNRLFQAYHNNHTFGAYKTKQAAQMVS